MVARMEGIAHNLHLLVTTFSGFLRERGEKECAKVRSNE